MEVNCLLCLDQRVDGWNHSPQNSIIVNMDRHGGNSSGCLGNHGGGWVLEGVDRMWISSDSLDNSWGCVVNSVDSCGRGSDSLYDSWSSGVVNSFYDSWSWVM